MEFRTNVEMAEGIHMHTHTHTRMQKRDYWTHPYRGKLRQRTFVIRSLA